MLARAIGVLAQVGLKLPAYVLEIVFWHWESYRSDERGDSFLFRSLSCSFQSSSLEEPVALAMRAVLDDAVTVTVSSVSQAQPIADQASVS